MTSTPIASDLSYECLQLRRLRGELGPCALDSTNQVLHAFPSVLVQREAFVVDRLDTGDCARPNLQPARASVLDLSLTPIVGQRER